MPCEIEIRQNTRYELFELLRIEYQLRKLNEGKGIALDPLQEKIAKQKARMEQEDVKLVEKQLYELTH